MVFFYTRFRIPVWVYGKYYIEESLLFTHSFFYQTVIDKAKLWIPRGNQYNHRPFVNDHISVLKVQLPKARRKAGETKYPLDVRVWKRSVATLLREISIEKHDAFNNFIASINYRRDKGVNFLNLFINYQVTTAGKLKRLWELPKGLYIMINM